MDTWTKISKFKSRFNQTTLDIIEYAFHKEDFSEEDWFDLVFYFAKKEGLIDDNGNMLFKDFEDLEREDLAQLRKEIVLNSYYIGDYENSFGFNAKDISYFFDGYMDYITELCEEDKCLCKKIKCSSSIFGTARAITLYVNEN